MFNLALAFLLLAVVAALFGFGGLAAASAGIAQILFAIFMAVFLGTLILSIVGGRKVV